MVVLALGLALAGILLAVQQARSFTRQRMAATETRASQIAELAQERFERQAGNILRTAAYRSWPAPTTDQHEHIELPVWLNGLYLRHDHGIRVVVPPSGQAAQQLEWLEQTLSQWPLDDTPAGRSGRVQFVYRQTGTSSAVIAYAQASAGDGRPVLVAGFVDLPRLRDAMVEPLVGADENLELVSAGTEYAPWTQSMYGVMRFWAIKPTDRYVRELRGAVFRQTVTSSGLTLLALATLLVAMTVLMRVVRRDVHLAQMKANFVADVSHELKTPLALIRLFGETLQSGRVLSDEKRQEYYAIITRESVRLTTLIDNILDFARIEAGNRGYHFSPTDIGELTRTTYETYRSQLDHHGFEHHLAVDRSIPMVNADPDAIARVLINLINNAIKYCGDERYLHIDVGADTRRNRRGVLISVHDRGIGIRPEERSRVFQGFFRSSDRRVREKGGTGLGLALVRDIVDAHGGSMDVESRLVKGTTFRIFLPVAEPGTGSDAPASDDGSHTAPDAHDA